MAKLASPWKQEWKDQLAECLLKAQTGIPVNFVAIVAKESDLYFELLFLLGTLGLFCGTATLWLPLDFDPETVRLIPLLGFSVGCSVFHLRQFFLKRLATKAIRNRVLTKAKSLFYDHSQAHEGPTILLYFSEVEREAVLLWSDELHSQLCDLSTSRIFNRLAKNYRFKEPISPLKAAIEELSVLLRLKLNGPNLINILNQAGSAPLYFISSADKENPFAVPVLKGKKDIN